LIRIDDIAPAMNWRVWDVLESLLAGSEVRPILAVVPDNRDPQLVVGPAAPDFWDRVRQWQARHWTVAMHGYQHVWLTSNPGIVGICERSEFAGLPSDEQRRRLEAGLRIFRSEGVDVEAFVAPAHSFDATTIAVLADLGLRAVVDGFHLFPFSRGGMFYVPTQLWRWRWAPLGVWTVCLHINRWNSGDVESFWRGLRRFRGCITSLEDVTDQWKGRQPTVVDAAWDHLWRALVRYRMGRLYRRRA